MSEYQKQAEKFLTDNNIRLTVTKSQYQSRPQWQKTGDYGIKYDIALQGFNRQTVRFPFWDSISAKEKGKKPNAYDILACISSDINCANTFKLFCSDFGCSEDSISARNTFNRCNKFSKKLNAFFSEKEKAELAEIQ